jgi:hypothetical protein
MDAGIVTALVVALARFPGGAPLASPSGRFVVENEDRNPDAAVRHAHALHLVERRTRERHLLLEYGREVAAAWAPDRDALAITNHVGSTQSTLLVVLVEPGGTLRQVDVGEALYAAFPSLRGELVSYLHVHLELVRWRRGGVVECRLRAYAGSGPELTRRYAVSTDGQAELLGGPKRTARPASPPREQPVPGEPRS